MAWKASPAAASFEDSDEHPSAMPGTGLGLVGRSPEPWPGLQVSLHRRRSAVMRIVLRCRCVCTGSLLILSARLWRNYDDACEAPPRSFEGTSAGGLEWPLGGRLATVIVATRSLAAVFAQLPSESSS